MGRKSKVKKEPKDRYLAIPYHILNLHGIELCEKVLLAHIHSFGEKGCYQSNKTLADIFMVSARRISRWIRHLRPYLYIKNPKGYYRTMWAKAHPEVRAAAGMRRIQDRVCPVHLRKSDEHLSQESAGDCVKSEVRLSQKCATTNNNTNRETKRDTIATPPPLAPKGAAALLEDRTRDSLARIERFKHEFGKSKKPYRPLTEQQFQQRRQTQLKALVAG